MYLFCLGPRCIKSLTSISCQCQMLEEGFCAVRGSQTGDPHVLEWRTNVRLFLLYSSAVWEAFFSGRLWFRWETVQHIETGPAADEARSVLSSHWWSAAHNAKTDQSKAVEWYKIWIRLHYFVEVCMFFFCILQDGWWFSQGSWGALKNKCFTWLTQGLLF